MRVQDLDLVVTPIHQAGLRQPFQHSGLGVLDVDHVVVLDEVELPLVVRRPDSRTIAMLRAEGFNAKGLSVTEIGKLDAGLSCMSLRWSKA